MTPTPPSNVKVYDRPERKGLPPAVLAIVVLLIVIIGIYFGYKMLHHAASSTASSGSTSLLCPARPESTRLSNVVLYVERVAESTTGMRG